MALYVIITTVLGILTLVAVGLAVLLGIGLSTRSRASLVARLQGLERHPIAWGCLVALIATSGSLYFSEIVHLAPCSLCWYQRIAMYPLVPILAVGAARRDPGVWRYALPLAAVGLLIAAYHVVIEWRPALDVGVCTSGVPCTARYFAVFGFVSIATMSAAAFLLILALLMLVRGLESVAEEAPEEAAEARV